MEKYFFNSCYDRVKSVTPSTNLPKKLAAIDSLIRAVLCEDSAIPGIAAAIIVEGKTVLLKGYGLKDHADNQSLVTPRTLFNIGSCSKAFTVYALDRLINVDVALAWNDKVIDHIPEFQLKDEYATSRIQIKDLVTHVSGLPRHEFIWYHNSKFTRNDILARLPYLEPSYDLREMWQYNNLTFTVSALVAEKVAGKSWEDLMRDRVFEPADLKHTYISIEEARKKDTDFALPHTKAAGAGGRSIESILYLDLKGIAPAGAIISCAEDLAKWVQLQLGLSGRSKEMHIPHVAMPAEPLDGISFAHGLGWWLAFYHGRLMVHHGGTIDGFVSNVVLFPEDNQGIVLLMNSDARGMDFCDRMAQQIADILTDRSSASDVEAWVSKEMQSHNVQAESPAANSSAEQKDDVPRPEQYEGHFTNPGYGPVDIRLVESQLLVRYNDLRYVLEPKKGLVDAFTARSPAAGFSFGCSFERDRFGDVNGFHFDLEPNVNPIYFAKKMRDDLYALNYLTKFESIFGAGQAIVQFRVNETKHALIASGAARYTGELHPYSRTNCFSLKRKLFEFVEEDGVLSKLNVYEGDHMTTFQRR